MEEITGKALVTPGHVYSTQHAERACIRLDRKLGREAEHWKGQNVPYVVDVKNTNEVESSGEYELIPDEEIVTLQVTGREGPYPGRTQSDGKESGEWFKFNLAVVGGDWDGFKLTYLTDVKITTRNKSGRMVAAFLGTTSDDLPAKYDWDELEGLKARGVIGTRKTDQGGVFNTVKTFLKLSTSRQRQQAES